MSKGGNIFEKTQTTPPLRYRRVHFLCHKIRFSIYFGYISLYFRSSRVLGFSRLNLLLIQIKLLLFTVIELHAVF